MPPKELKQIDEVTWELPVTYKEGMNVPARIIGTKTLIDEMDDGVFDQVSNVATLPGIVKYAYCMPDGHWGYGFPIGGVAAFDPDEGVISPGGIGFDINCGMRLITTNLTKEEVLPKIKPLVDLLFKRVPTGVGCKGFVDLTDDQFKGVMEQGTQWCVDNGYGWQEDVEHTEENGCIKGADPSKVSPRAIKRGINQLGTLGSGNHYLEIQYASPDAVLDKETAAKLGITRENQVVIMVHCGSRGFGHQIATDYLKRFIPVMRDHGITIRDKELACAPFRHRVGQDYYAAMACAANMAFANRQVITHRIREAFEEIFGKTAEEMEMHLVYDVAHNIAKLENHLVDGERREVLVHRKGATRSFGPGEEDVPEMYKDIGQPVIIGGSMETGSYLMTGTRGAMETTFGSTCHGSGRTMSRTKAKKQVRGEELQKRMEKEEHIYVHAASMSGLAEEAGFAYKDVTEVVESCRQAGISKPIVLLKPLGNVKGATRLMTSMLPLVASLAAMLVAFL